MLVVVVVVVVVVVDKWTGNEGEARPSGARAAHICCIALAIDVAIATYYITYITTATTVESSINHAPGCAFSPPPILPIPIFSFLFF